MEAVPRLHMLWFALKSSPSGTSFAPLKKFIAEFYQEDPESYSKEVFALETLRNRAMHSSKEGCSVMKRYYCQLHSLQNRFPQLNERNIFTFTWKDLYQDQTSEYTELRYEIAAVLFNIAASHTQLGASVTRGDVDGMKLACTHFQCAAWAFGELRERFAEVNSGADFMTSELLVFMQQVSFAQAQECILEKSLIDNRKPNIVAKVTAQIVVYYGAALAALLTGGDDGPVSQCVESAVYKLWKKYVRFKISYLNCILYLYQGQHAEEQQKMGERVTLYQAAWDKLEEARKESKGLPDQKEIVESLTFTADVVEAKRKNAKNENEFIYHEAVPELSSIGAVQGANLVNGISFSVTDPEIAGDDIFSRLVPMKAHEASSLYSEEKAKLLRKYGGLIDDKDLELTSFMSSLTLENLNINAEKANKIPQGIVDRCAALNANKTAIPDLIASMSQLADICADVEMNLKEIASILSAEEREEREFQTTTGVKRTPNAHITELTREYQKYLEAHTRAGESNDTLRKAMELHVNNLKILAKPLPEIQHSVPKLSSELNTNEIFKDVKLILNKVNEMKAQRSQFHADLRIAVNSDDITSKVIAHSSEEGLQSLFDKELAKHERLTQLIDQNLLAQKNILQALTESYARAAPILKTLADVKHKRENFFSSLAASYDVYEDLLAKSAKGLEFYKKLAGNVQKLLTRLKSARDVQAEERQQRLKNVSAGNSPQQLQQQQQQQQPHQHSSPTLGKAQTNTTISGSTPTLRDYLKAKNTNAASIAAAGPIPNLPPSSTGNNSANISSYIPTVRPNPLGSENPTKAVCSSVGSGGGVGYYGPNNGINPPSSGAGSGIAAPNEPPPPYSLQQTQYYDPMAAGYTNPMFQQQQQNIAPPAYKLQASPNSQFTTTATNLNAGFQNLTLQGGQQQQPSGGPNMPLQTGPQQQQGGVQAGAGIYGNMANIPQQQQPLQQIPSYGAGVAPLQQQQQQMPTMQPQQQQQMPGYLTGGSTMHQQTQQQMTGYPVGVPPLQQQMPNYPTGVSSMQQQQQPQQQNILTTVAGYQGMKNVSATGGSYNGIQQQQPHLAIQQNQTTTPPQQQQQQQQQQLPQQQNFNPNPTMPAISMAPQGFTTSAGISSVPGSLNYSNNMPIVYPNLQQQQQQQQQPTFAATQHLAGNPLTSLPTAHIPTTQPLYVSTTEMPTNVRQEISTPSPASKSETQQGSHIATGGVGGVATSSPLNYNSPQQTSTSFTKHPGYHFNPQTGQYEYGSGYQQGATANTQFYGQYTSAASAMQQGKIGGTTDSLNAHKMNLSTGFEAPAVISHTKSNKANSTAAPNQNQNPNPTATPPPPPPPPTGEAGGNVIKNSGGGDTNVPLNYYTPPYGYQSLNQMQPGGAIGIPSTLNYNALQQQAIYPPPQQQQQQQQQQKQQFQTEQNRRDGSLALPPPMNAPIPTQSVNQQNPTYMQSGSASVANTQTTKSAAEYASSPQQQASVLSAGIKPTTTRSPSKLTQPSQATTITNKKSSNIDLLTDIDFSSPGGDNKGNGMNGVPAPLLPEPILKPVVVPSPPGSQVTFTNSPNKKVDGGEETSKVEENSNEIKTSASSKSPMPPLSPQPVQQINSPTTESISSPPVLRKPSYDNLSICSDLSSLDNFDFDSVSMAAGPTNTKSHSRSSSLGANTAVNTINTTTFLMKPNDPFADYKMLKYFHKEVERYEKLIESLNVKMLNGNTQLSAKWKELQDLLAKDSSKHTTSIAKLFPEKNRSLDCLPYDHARVQLEKDTDNYINAAFVKDLGAGCPTFIIAQTPQHNTLNDFWSMVWSQKARTVICLHTSNEMLDPYWPQDLDKETHFDDYTVKCVKINNLSHCMEYNLKLSMHGADPIIDLSILQIKAWTKSLPTQIIGIATNALNAHQERCLQFNTPTSPLIINCLTGSERSELLAIAICTILSTQTKRPMLINVVDVWHRICNQRQNAVRDMATLEQSMQIVLTHAHDVLNKRGIMTSYQMKIAPQVASKEKEEIKDPLNELDPLWKLK